MITWFFDRFATMRLLSWLTVTVIAPLDRRLLLATNGRLSLTGSSTVLLISRGARSGALRYSSLPGLCDGETIILLASKGGAPTHPAWYHNLVKNPQVEILENGQRRRYRAYVTQGPRREERWQWLLEQWGGFAVYQQRAGARVLPVVELIPEDAPTTATRDGRTGPGDVEG